MKNLYPLIFPFICKQLQYTVLYSVRVCVLCCVFFCVFFSLWRYKGHFCVKSNPNPDIRTLLHYTVSFCIVCLCVVFCVYSLSAGIALLSPGFRRDSGVCTSTQQPLVHTLHTLRHTTRSQPTTSDIQVIRENINF